MDPRYFDVFQIYEEPERIFERYRSLLPHLGESPESILDVGCGDGHGLVALRQHYPTARLIGVEVSGPRISAARATTASISRVELLNRDLVERGLPGGPVDEVICTEVLEHVIEWEKLFLCMTQIASKGVVVSVPYNEDLASRRCPHCDEHYYRFGHINSFDERSFSRLVTEGELYFRHTTTETGPIGRGHSLDERWARELCPNCLQVIELDLAGLRHERRTMVVVVRQGR